MRKKWLVIGGVGAMALVGLMASVILIFSQSIRLDESQTIWIASKSIPEMMKLTGEDVHLPLYNGIIHFVIQLFGNNIKVVRLVSLLFLALEVPTLFVLTKENYRTKAAILACAMLVFSPFVIWYSAEARMYSLLLWTTTLNHIFFLRMVKSRGKKAKLGYLISGVAGIFSHYFFWLVLLTQGIYLMIKMSQRLVRPTEFPMRKSMSKEVFYAYSLVIGVLLLIISPWLGYVVTLGSASNTQPLISKPTSYNIVVAMVNFVFGFQKGDIQNVLVSLWPLSAIVILVAFTRRNKNKLKNTTVDYFVLSAVLPIAITFLVSLFRPVFLSRYLIFVVPSWFVVVGWILADQKRQITVTITALLIFTMSSLMLNQAVSADTPVKEDYSQLDDYLKTKTTGEDIVAVTTPFTIYPVEYGYRGAAKLETIPEWDRYTVGAIPSFDENKMKDQIKGYTKIYQNVFVVLSYDQGFESKIVDYMDHNYQMVDHVRFPASIEVREYKLRYQ